MQRDGKVPRYPFLDIICLPTEIVIWSADELQYGEMTNGNSPENGLAWKSVNEAFSRWNKSLTTAGWQYDDDSGAHWQTQ
jgi:hypothetical protein